MDDSEKEAIVRSAAARVWRFWNRETGCGAREVVLRRVLALELGRQLPGCIIQEEVDLPIRYPLKSRNSKTEFVEVGHTRIDLMVRADCGTQLFGVELKVAPATQNHQRQALFYSKQIAPTPVFLVCLSPFARAIHAKEHIDLPPVQISVFSEGSATVSPPESPRRASP